MNNDPGLKLGTYGEDLSELGELLCTRDVAAMLGMPPDRIRRMAREHQIPHVRMTPRSIRYPRRAVEAWLRDLQMQAAQNVRR